MPNGGATKAVMSLLENLMPRGVEPIVVVPDRDGICSTLKAKGIETYVLRYKHNTYPDLRSAKDAILFVPRVLGRLWLNWKATSQLIRLLRERKVELVHTNVSVIDIGHRAARRLGLPHVYHFREYADMAGFRYMPSKKCFYRSITGEKDYSICITRGIQEYHHQTGPHARVIYDGVKNKASSMPDVQKENYFLYAGRIEPNKGLADLLKAYDEALQTAPSLPMLKVAGASSGETYTQRVKSFVKSQHLEQRVEFLGECQNIDQLMQHAVALIVPSRFEGFGFCMAEAMFNGCIVVGYNDTGTKEQFENGMQQTGAPIGYPYNSHEELRDCLVMLGGESSSVLSEREVVRERAFNVVNELYTTEKNAQHVYEFYQNMKSPSQPPLEVGED